jgi:hypothetical protein
MKKILYSIIAGLVLASCGSFQGTTNNTAATTTTTTTETTTSTTASENALSSVLGGLTQGATQTLSESYTAGQQSGVALKALYNQYKADGKLDFSNLSNVANILNISAQVQKLTQADKDSVSYTDFSRGLIEGSVNLVNELNAEQVTETLVSKLGNIDTTKLNETADKAQTAVSNVSSAASSIMDVLSLFKQQ